LDGKAEDEKFYALMDSIGEDEGRWKEGGAEYLK